MFKSVMVFGVALATLVLWGHAAFAGNPGEFCIFGFCFPIGGGGGGNPAPAPLLAAGIPAFSALGGGVLVSRLFRKRKS